MIKIPLAEYMSILLPHGGRDGSKQRVPHKKRMKKQLEEEFEEKYSVSFEEVKIKIESSDFSILKREIPFKKERTNINVLSVNSKKRKQRRVWTEEDIQYLMREYGNKSDQEIAKNLNWPIASINSKRQQLVREGKWIKEN